MTIHTQTHTLKHYFKNVHFCICVSTPSFCLMRTTTTTICLFLCASDCSCAALVSPQANTLWKGKPIEQRRILSLPLPLPFCVQSFSSFCGFTSSGSSFANCACSQCVCVCGCVSLRELGQTFSVCVFYF